MTGPKGLPTNLGDLLFFDEDRRPLVPDGPRAVAFDDADVFDEFLAHGVAEVYEPCDDDLAEILYTSGSTGMPKGVPLTHRGQLWAIGKYLEPVGDGGSAESSLIVAPLYHMNALVFSSACLLNGVMRRDADGFFSFVSRADDVFVCGGEKIHPGSVEEILNRHPAVQQSLVVGAPDDFKGMVPVAFVVPTRGAVTDESEIKAFVLEHGPAYAHPRRVVFKDSLPLGGTHKIDRRSLELEAAELMVAEGRASVG
jgi:acyl-coenzyme A synthetase/AMP-(fatty) acid ligase